MSSSTHNYLVLSAVGRLRPELPNELIRACTQCGCNIVNLKQSVLGQEICLMFYLSGNWGAIAKMETTIPSLEQRLGLTFIMRRTSNPIMNTKMMSYNIQVSAIDKEGILSGLTDFFYRQGIPIEEISTNTFSSNTGTKIANLNLRINVKEKVHLATLREQFANYCDDNNLDAFFEPARNF